eukprot:1984749-Lingulodinium_polyedra.AAC.1
MARRYRRRQLPQPSRGRTRGRRAGRGWMADGNTRNASTPQRSSTPPQTAGSGTATNGSGMART